jgi:hypothetical protein
VTVYKGVKALRVVDYRGNEANLIVVPSIDGIVPVAAKDSKELGPLMGPKKNYMISAKMFFVRMPKISQVSESPDDFKKLAAEHVLDAEPIKLSMANGRFVMRHHRLAKYAGVSIAAKAAQGARGAVKGPSAGQLASRVSGKVKSIAKVGFDFNYLQPHETSFLLGAFGLDREKIAAAMDGARKCAGVIGGAHIEIHHPQWPSTKPQVMKLASAKEREIIKSMRAPFEVILKVAAALDDSESVDSVLSLGFINEENIDRFAAAKPLLEEVTCVITKLLLASRLGMSDIPEEATRLALMHLQRVTSGLDKLKMLGEQQNQPN